MVCIGCIKWTEKNKKKKNCDDAFNVNNFRLRFYVFNYRVAASLWQRDETTAKLDEARPPLESAIHAIFCALPITKIVCVCVCVLARAYTCACLFRLFSLRYVFSTLHLADLTIYIPSPLSGSSFPRTKTETNVPSTVPLGTLKSRHFSP